MWLPPGGLPVPRWKWPCHRQEGWPQWGRCCLEQPPETPGLTACFSRSERKLPSLRKAKGRASAAFFEQVEQCDPDSLNYPAGERTGGCGAHRKGGAFVSGGQGWLLGELHLLPAPRCRFLAP